MIVAITRPTGPELSRCELTHIDRAPIDVARAVAQHSGYLRVLRRLGVQVVELPRLPGYPDAVFVEDVALVLPEIAVVLRPGAESRLGEMESMAQALGRHRTVVAMEAPATLDGGDVLVVGRTIVCGETTRTNHDGVRALRALVESFGYEVVTVPVTGVLHLKSAATLVDDDTVLVNPAHVDVSILGLEILEVHPEEPHGANVVRLGDTVLADASAPRTIAMLEGRGEVVIPVEVDEFAKAEGAISCKGVIFEA